MPFLSLLQNSVTAVIDRFQPEPDFKGKNTNDSCYQKPTAKSWAMPRVVVKIKRSKPISQSAAFPINFSAAYLD
jgi:hypothetical protein